MENTLLYLLPAFPPQGGTLTLRSVKQIKYLAQMDWEPVVISFEMGDSSMKDRSLLQDVPPACEIHRLQSRSKVFLLPELFKTVGKILTEKSVRCLITSSPPDQLIYVGFFVSKFFGLNWHADLREPPRRKKSLLATAKKSFLRQAHLITSPWPWENIWKRDEKPWENYSRIPHSFDSDDFSDVDATDETEDRTDVTRFIHTGSLFPDGRSPLVLLDILGELIETGEVGGEEIQFVFIGTVTDDSLRKKVQERLKNERLSEIVEFESFQDHRTVTREIADSDVCFGFHRTGLLALKIYEYLGSKNPIVAYYGSDSPMKRDLAGKSGIYWVDYGNEERLKEVIRDLVIGKEYSVPDRELIESYTTQRVVSTLDKYY